MSIGPNTTPAVTDGVEIFRGLYGKTRYFTTISSILALTTDTNPTFGTVTLSSLAFTGGAVASVDTASTHKIAVNINNLPYYILLVQDQGG